MGIPLLPWDFRRPVLGVLSLLLQGGKCFEQHFLPQSFLFLWGQIRVAQDMDNAASLHHAVGAHHLGHWHDGGHLGHGNTGFFEFRRDRSTAASRSASRGGKNDRCHPLCFEFLGNFSSQPPAVGQGIHQA